MNRSVDQNTANTRSRYSLSHQTCEEMKERQNMQKRLETLRNNEIKIKNRVNLLESEQKRILKKVEETRARADRMKVIKEVNEQNYLEKMQRQEEIEVNLR